MPLVRAAALKWWAIRGPSGAYSSRPEARTPPVRIRPAPTAAPIHGSADVTADAATLAMIPASPNNRTKLAVTVTLTTMARPTGRWPPDAPRSSPRYSPRYAGRSTNPHGFTAATIPATKAYPSGALAPSDSSAPEMRADSVSTKISGPGAADVARIPAATASPSTAAVTPAASQVRAGDQDNDCSADIARPQCRSGRMAARRLPPSPITGPPWLTTGPGTGPHRARGPNSR